MTSYDRNEHRQMDVSLINTQFNENRSVAKNNTAQISSRSDDNGLPRRVRITDNYVEVGQSQYAARPGVFVYVGSHGSHEPYYANEVVTTDTTRQRESYANAPSNIRVMRNNYFNEPTRNAQESHAYYSDDPREGQVEISI